MPQRQSQTVSQETPEDERRLDKIVRALTGFSVRQAQGLFAADGVTLNGQVSQEPWKRLSPGDVVEVAFESGRRYKPAPKPRSYSGFELVFEDQHLLVVNKAAHLLTVPTDRGETNTLLHRLSEYLARGQSFRPKVWIVHRLDRGVSGLLVFGKRAEVATALREQLSEHKPLRRYAAIVAGVVQDESGTLRSYLATNQKSLTRYSSHDPSQGELAVTHYRVLERFHAVSLLEVQLETGRRNQIRVHLAEAGHPILGDERYGTAQSKKIPWTAKRLALAAVELGFTHPVAGKSLHFKLPQPPEFRSFLAKSRRHPA